MALLQIYPADLLQLTLGKIAADALTEDRFYSQAMAD